jgi:tRNA-binding protein
MDKRNISMLTWEQFEQVELRVGTIIRVQDFPKARKPAYQLWIDLGELGVKKSSAQITGLYGKEDLLNKQVLCVTNFPPRQVADFMSEVLTTGFILQAGEVVLAVPERPIPNGSRLA